MKVLVGTIISLCILAILPVTMCLNSREKDTGNYLIIGYPHRWLSFHAGPSAGVFDSDGTLVDFSSNPGDDPHFRDKWEGTPGKERKFSNFIRNHLAKK